MTSKCDGLIRQKTWQIWNSAKNEKNRHNFLKFRKEVGKKIKKVKEDNDNELLNQINENFNKNNSRNFYQIFKHKLTKCNPPSPQIEVEVGKKAHSNTDNSKISQNISKID